MTITLTIGEKKIELTPEEAKQVRKELNDLLGEHGSALPQTVGYFARCPAVSRSLPHTWSTAPSIPDASAQCAQQ